MKLIGTAYEEVSLVITGGGRTLYQETKSLSGSGVSWDVNATGVADFIIPVKGFPENAEITFTINYINVTGSYSDSFLYDSVVDPILFTTHLSENMYILSGITEPRVSGISVTINGEAVSRKSIVRDVYGSFTVDMPLVLEGDEIYVTVTDLANNVYRFGPYTVGVGSKNDTMKAFAMGKLYTNARGMSDDETPDWTMITYLRIEELTAGVDLPMAAANAFVCGNVHLALQVGQVVATVAYDEGVETDDIYLGVQGVSSENERPDVDAFLARAVGSQTDGTSNGYWICVSSNVSLPSNLMKTSFHLENGGDNDVRALYMNRQRRQPLNELEEKN